MKKCPYCAEEIQDEAVKCRYCGEFLTGNRRAGVKWYARTSTLIASLLMVGPLALPLVWLNPEYSRKKKIILSCIILAVSFVLLELMASSLGRIREYYRIILNP